MNTHYAGFWKRVAVNNIDGIAHLLIIPIFVNIYLYFAKGRTIGDYVMKTKLVRAGTDMKPGTGQLFGRFFTKIISAIPLFLGFMWAGWAPEKQAWHDTMSGTRYVETEQYAGGYTWLGVLGTFILSGIIQGMIQAAIFTLFQTIGLSGEFGMPMNGYELNEEIRNELLKDVSIEIPVELPDEAVR